LQAFRVEDLVYAKDRNSYPEPHQIAIYMTLKDVYLGYFENRQLLLNGISSGDKLFLFPNGLGNDKSEQVLSFSTGFNSKLNTYISKGYKPFEAKVNFIVHWTNKNNNKESKIILPELLLRK
jgi:ATP-dependent DNA helicase RecQ